MELLFYQKFVSFIIQQFVFENKHDNFGRPNILNISIVQNFTFKVKRINSQYIYK